MNIAEIIHNVRNAVLSPRGRSMLIFLMFVAISGVMWMIMTLNEEIQKDLRCRIEIVNCPDSVTMVSYLPEAINVNVKAKGSQLIKYSWGDMPTVKVDYKYFIKGNTISLGEADMRGLFRNMFGAGAQILAMNPDSLNLQFTSRAPVRLPLTVDSRVTSSPSAVLVGTPKCSSDSVLVYSVNPLDPAIRRISTAPVVLSGLEESKTMRVRVLAPAGTRVVPDSVNVTVEVEKLIVSKADVAIEAVGVPKGENLLLFPDHVEVSYMLPMDDYKNSRRDFRVVADYNSIAKNPGGRRVRLKVVTMPTGRAQNFSLSLDSVSYMIER